MATTSTIAVQHSNGTVSQIYCHWDGYPAHNGRLLVEYYSTLEAAELLVSLGDLSVLGNRIHPIGEHSFEASEDGTCVYYGRDRCESGVEPSEYSDYETYRITHRAEEYDYIFVEGNWYLQFPKSKTLVKDCLSESK